VGVWRANRAVRQTGRVPEIIDDLQWRGLIADSTDLDRLRAAFRDGPVTFYCGFDPTAASLHVGNLVQILVMRRLQEAGHRPLALVGGATGLIGDPKEAGERTLNEAETVVTWGSRIEAQLRAFLSFEGSVAARMVNNYDWTQNLSAIELLRDIGKHFSVNRMLDREAVAARLNGSGISYTEFSYQLLQSYDFVRLNGEFDCQLQTGGSDQWGNITAGVALVRRMNGKQVHAMTTPLLEKADGTKFGKTESGTIWLDPELTSPYAFYQFWFNADDRDVASWLKVFSLGTQAEVAGIIADSAERPHARIGQRALAGELTALVHGSTACAAVVAASGALFGQGELAGQDPVILGAALAETDFVTMLGADATDGEISIVDLLAVSKLVAGKGAARRMIAEGGAYLNNERVSSIEQRVSAADLLNGEWLVLRRGRKTMVGVSASVLA
jgi:tyrosyl-tRNA synthetase